MDSPLTCAELNSIDELVSDLQFVEDVTLEYVGGGVITNVI